MTDRTPLTPQQVDEAVATLDSWRVDDGKLVRSLVFPTFARAWGFLTAVALVAERLDHHPAWSNTYTRVEICLWTHDANAITALDLRLARAVDALAR